MKAMNVAPHRPMVLENQKVASKDPIFDAYRWANKMFAVCTFFVGVLIIGFGLFFALAASGSEALAKYNTNGGEIVLVGFLVLGAAFALKRCT